jgi:hypothetical protein
MSRTAHNGKGPGYDFWKRRMRYSASWGYGSDIKRLSSRLHRRTARSQLSVGEIESAEATNLRMRGMTPT